MTGFPALLAQDKKPPEKLTFTTNGNRLGNVTFDHSAQFEASERGVHGLSSQAVSGRRQS
jgi:hypothetical protein